MADHLDHEPGCAPAQSAAASQTSELGALCLRVPLAAPYKLALGVVDAFDSIIVTLRAGEAIGFGEATVLTGYTEETIEESWRLTRDLVARHSGRPLASLLAELDRLAPAAPFTATAFRTAAEMAWRHPLLFSPGERRIPLLAIVNAVEAEHIAAEVEARLAEGYRTLKIKVGFEADSDLARVRFIQGLVAGTATALTIDANQGYRREEGCAFAARLQPDNIQFFEQACHKNDWDAAVAVARASTVPVMLDESIYGLEDVERAAALGAAHYVKLKLMKLGGLDRLTAAIDRVTQLGLTPVLGNGVATDIGCWMEAAVAHGRLSTAGEMNGFLKPAKGLLANGLRVESGDLVIPAHWSPRYDAQTLAACCVATAGEPMPTSAA